jgi:hypothetical protein
MAILTGYTHGTRSRRALVGFSLVAAVGVLALSGCASERHSPPTMRSGGLGTTESPALTATPAPSGTAAPPPGAVTATDGSVASSGVAAKPAARGPASACTVTAETLLSALKATSTNMYKRAGRPAGLQTPVCYGTFAVAQTVPDSGVQQSSVLFGFDTGSRTWRALNLGSADFCAGYVPADVAAHLPGCA